MKEQLTTQDLRDYADARVQADRTARRAEPCAWMQNIDAALKEPLFHELRGVMGTENMGQDIALLQTLRRYRAKALDAKCAEIERLKIHLIDAQELIQKMMAQTAAPEGFKLVPLEPTQAMLLAGQAAQNSACYQKPQPDGEAWASIYYHAMLAAAPDYQP